jgi:ribosomal small subunit protein bTHX
LGAFLCNTIKVIVLLRFIVNKYHNLHTMGRGDFRTKRGKIRRGSFGNSRPNPSKMRAAAKKKKA